MFLLSLKSCRTLVDSMIDFEFFRVKVKLLIVDVCGGVLSTLSGRIDSLLKNEGVLLAFSNIDGCLCRGVMGCFLMSLLELSVLIIFALDSLRLLGMKIRSEERVGKEC